MSDHRIWKPQFLLARIKTRPRDHSTAYLRNNLLMLLVKEPGKLYVYSDGILIVPRRCAATAFAMSPQKGTKELE